VGSVDGAGARPRAQSPELDISCSAFKLLSELCRYQFPLSRVVERLVLLATDPEMMEQRGKLACDGYDRSSLSSFTSTLSQLQSPSA
jgi:hypothetical protein